MKCGEILHDNCGSVWFACSFCNLLEFRSAEDYLFHISKKHLINSKTQPYSPSKSDNDCEEVQYNPFRDSPSPSPSSVLTSYNKVKSISPLQSVTTSDAVNDINKNNLNGPIQCDDDHFWNNEDADSTTDNESIEANDKLKRQKITIRKKYYRSKTNHVCTYCNKLMPSKFSLISHLRKHTNEKPFECEICKKSFPYKISLTLHMRIHNNERPFLCSNCGFAARTSSQLICHQKRAHGEKEFIKCDLCNRIYESKVKFEYHMKKVHSNKKLICDICDSTFKHRSLLVQHMYIHSGTKPYKCRYCGLDFAQGAGRRCHEKRAHEKDLCV